ncbi:chemotaxis protein CheB [Pseudobacter ginsenosidimutans]|uniref:protein-glutamate methylesterase n=1 Tax=Pseudobacter ginsenosidimutans TaxID=661488 RepID=A0A4Q7N5D9_9BACT|nr:chemotaxis protein CheB [Pseudobacter ginsenosidimutans]QEC44776.1 chemotaxis protein CheB [Pseudobacter ginsenosidimutans]RZS76262.1 CheB methylesterase [Pseudobacter ginsenosidimutans]
MEKDLLNRTFNLIIIGGSAGSLQVILKLLPELRLQLPVTIVIVLHRKPSHDETLVELLSAKSRWPVREVEEKEPILPNHIYIAPADYHLLVESDFTFSLDVSEKVNYSRPSIDIAFESAAEVYGPSVLAILLSGANADGQEGMQNIKSAGGACIVQDPDTAEVAYMPLQAITHVEIDNVLHAEEMAPFLNVLFEQR